LVVGGAGNGVLRVTGDGAGRLLFIQKNTGGVFKKAGAFSSKKVRESAGENIDKSWRL